MVYRYLVVCGICLCLFAVRDLVCNMCCDRCYIFVFYVWSEVDVVFGYYMYVYLYFFFNDPATTDIYTYSHTLSLHDARPILVMSCMVLSVIEESDERRRSWASERRSTIRPAMHTAMGSDNPAFSKLLRTRVSGVAHAANARRERRKANFFMQAIFQNNAGSQC